MRKYYLSTEGVYMLAENAYKSEEIIVSVNSLFPLIQTLFPANLGLGSLVTEQELLCTWGWERSHRNHSATALIRGNFWGVDTLLVTLYQSSSGDSGFIVEPNRDCDSQYLQPTHIVSSTAAGSGGAGLPTITFTPIVKEWQFGN